MGHDMTEESGPIGFPHGGRRRSTLETGHVADVLIGVVALYHVCCSTTRSSGNGSIGLIGLLGMMTGVV